MRNNIEPDFVARNRWILRLLVGGSAILILVWLLRLLQGEDGVAPGSPIHAGTESVSSAGAGSEGARRVTPPRGSSASARTAEAIVADKVAQFGRHRREIVRGIALRTQKEIPAEVDAFFDAVESGVWEEIQARWRVLAKRSGQYEKSTHWEELNPFWPAVLDAYGAAEQAHIWPAQKLLDYGNAILSSLKPGMVYVGGTDNGRWVPELLNETSGAEPHIIVTQNALADARYLEYVDTLYGERFAALNKADSDRAFQEYIADAQKRLEHDQQFPDEPKQLRPGEDARMVDGKMQVSGQVAVMAINEKLLQMLMDKNPDLSFALQESFPMRGTYGEALPLGPLMELRAQDGQDAFTPERAAQSLDYWRTRAQEILMDAEATGSSTTLKTYSHDVVSAGNLLAAHNFTTEAEQMYGFGMKLWPENPEPVGNLADLLTSNGRENEARQLLDDYERKYPGQRKDVERIRARVTFTRTADLKSP